MGLTVGPVPSRVDADVKAGLLDLVNHATKHGWSTRRAAGVLDVNDERVRRWQARRAAGEPLDDAPSGPEEPLHALLPAEREAIVAIYEQWHEVDRSHRKLAHRGSREEVVWVSESTVWRVLKAEGLVIPTPTPRGPTPPRKPWPDWVEYRPCQVWGHDFSAFMAADTDALAILDLVSRKWITTLLVAHGTGTSETITAAYTDGLDAERLLPVIEQRMIEPNSNDRLPVLLAVSDNGPQMTSGTTREWMALHALAMHLGRPGVPTDQAHIESFFGHVKADWPHLEAIRDRATLAAALAEVRHEYNTVRLHAGIGYVTPEDEHEGRGEQIRKKRREGLAAARAARIAYRRTDPTESA